MKPENKLEILAALEPLLPKIVDAVISGPKGYYEKYGEELRLEHSPISKANLMRDGMVGAIAKDLGSLPGCRVIHPHKSVFLLLIGDDIVIWFKKVGKNGMVAGSKSMLATRYRNQEVITLIEKAVHLHCGPRLDHLNRDIEEVLLLCPKGERILWAQSVYKGPDAMPDMFERAPVSPTPTQVISRVVVKGPKTKEKHGTNHN